MKAYLLAAGVAAILVSACFRPTTQFDRYMAAGNWSDAAREFAADTSLRDTERGLYQAGVLYGTPGRSTYDPPKARDLFNRLLMRFPGSKYRDEATARLLLLEEMQHLQEGSEQRERELEVRIAALVRETRELKAKADSTAAQSDSLRNVVARLDADRKTKEEQLNALRLELQKLKEIDLKPRAPTRPPLTP